MSKVELLRGAFKQGKEIHGKVREVHGKAMEVHGKAMEIHGKIQGVQQQAQNLGTPLPRHPSGIPTNRAEAKGYARSCLCGGWAILKAKVKEYATYVGSVLLFAFIAIGLVVWLIHVLLHHPGLQLLTLTTEAKMSNTTHERTLNATGGERVDYRIHLLHYCVSGLAEKDEKKFNMTNGCHHSKQALYDHILPALSTTFTPPLPGKDVPGPSTEIQSLFRHYGYISFCLYILDIILLPIVAGVFIWWFISTLTPWKRTFRCVLCFFTATLIAPAFLQTVLIYRTIHILKHDIDLTTSSLNITLEPGFLNLFVIHFFWVLLLFNITVFRLIDCCRNQRKIRKNRQAQSNYIAQQSQYSYGDPQTQGIQLVQNSRESKGEAYVGHDVATDEFYRTESVELSKLPRKESAGISRKPLDRKYESYDLGERKFGV